MRVIIGRGQEIIWQVVCIDGCARKDNRRAKLPSFASFVMATLINCLRKRFAALSGAQKLAYLHDMS
ncbi:hypothetical protein [Nitrosomonas sp. sh817]|uniref:hypothetical protein n=1 Tax=Nitrosomonas sp. sh817 TaxID=3070658 RepID=UPI0027DDDC1D|nr:hypothetical protein [Nitrosomonas sp. sh817]WMJ09637.1 hypothetical protein RBH92_05435 [Nitrosomonas sp. sh817]